MPVCDPAAPLPAQLPANVPETAGEDGPGPWAPVSR